MPKIKFTLVTGETETGELVEETGNVFDANGMPVRPQDIEKGSIEPIKD